MDGLIEQERIMVRCKCSFGTEGGGFGYRLEAGGLPSRPEIKVAKAVWEDYIEGTAIEIMNKCEGLDKGKDESLTQVERASFYAPLC